MTSGYGDQRAHVSDAVVGISPDEQGKIAHDVRTPLAAILGYAEILHDLLDESADPAVARAVSGIHSNAERLRDVIDTIGSSLHARRGIAEELPPTVH